MLLVQSIYERHKGIMYKIAREHVREPADADDAVSNALLRLFRNAAKVRQLSGRALVTYIADTVRSAAVDGERRHRTEQRLFVSADTDDYGPAETAPSVEEAYAAQERAETRLRHLREALDELPEPDRALLIGKYLDGESDAMLASRLGVKPASVRMKLTRARDRARRIIERKEDGDGLQDQRKAVRYSDA